MMASSLGSSLAPVAGAPRARRGPRASRATSSTASDSSSRLDALLGEDLGDAVRTSLRRRDTAAAIDAAVASLERDSPTDHPVASPLLDGDWKLRYTTSAGSVVSVGAWETFGGAVFDVRQTCARRPDGAGVAITNIVTVRVPAPPAPPMPFPTIPIPDRPVAVRITQTFAAEATSRRRLETKLRESVVDVLRGNADDDESDASVRVPDAVRRYLRRAESNRRGGGGDAGEQSRRERDVEQSRGIVHPIRGGRATAQETTNHAPLRTVARHARRRVVFRLLARRAAAKIIYAVVGTVIGYARRREGGVADDGANSPPDDDDRDSACIISDDDSRSRSTRATRRGARATPPTRSSGTFVRHLSHTSPHLDNTSPRVTAAMVAWRERFVSRSARRRHRRPTTCPRPEAARSR